MDTAEDTDIQHALADLAHEAHRANVERGASLHPFPARMPVSLAQCLLTLLAPKACKVLDPMVGSGSTLVAARLLGHTGHGVDIDPLAVLISRVATASHRRETLDALGARVLTRATEIRAHMPRATVPTLLNSSDEEKTFIQYWFPSAAQRQLYALAQAIGEESAPALRSLAWAVFSSLIIAKQSSVSYAIDISRSRPHKDDERSIDPPFEVWNRRFGQLVNRLPFLDRPLSVAQPRVEQGDARCLGHDSDSVDVVLTSPPYLNAIDYIRGHKFSLLWMGHDLSSLRATRGRMIGSERGLWKPNGLPPSVECSLEEATTEGRVRAVTRRYLSDLRYSMLEMRRVVRKGGLVALVVGPSLLDRSAADSIDVVRALARSTRLRLVASVLRPLQNERRSLPPPRAVAKKSGLAARMTCEAIVVLRKETPEAP